MIKLIYQNHFHQRELFVKHSMIGIHWIKVYIVIYQTRHLRIVKEIIQPWRINKNILQLIKMLTERILQDIFLMLWDQLHHYSFVNIVKERLKPRRSSEKKLQLITMLRNQKYILQELLHILQELLSICSSISSIIIFCIRYECWP